MFERNKERLYLVLYDRSRPPNFPYQWALLLCPKDREKDTRDCTMYMVNNEAAVIGGQRVNDGMWRYKCFKTNPDSSVAMCAKILVTKVKRGRADSWDEEFKDLAVTQGWDSPRNWTRLALEHLRSRGFTNIPPLAELEVEATRLGDDWVAKDKDKKGQERQPDEVDLRRLPEYAHRV